MRLNTPIQITLFLSCIVSIISVFVFYLLEINVYLRLVLFIALVGISIYLILKKLFYQRIKIIYKNIYKFKGISNVADLDVDHVEREAKEWVEAKEAELNEYKKDQVYRREFIGNVSHELKTPIFNIQGYIETLLDGGLYDKSINLKYLQRTNKSVDRMINIIDDLEVISRLETEQAQLDLQSFNIITLVEEVFDAFEKKANQANITLNIVNESSSNFVIADQGKLQQVFLNLISNSIKYGKDGGETIVRFYDMEDNMLIEVADNGIGIDEYSLDRLFERFYRVDKNRSREIGGTGLGLAIVKHIIEGHNQQINVRSAIGIGTTFSFILKKF